jgi:hypothetical protein
MRRAWQSFSAKRGGKSAEKGALKGNGNAPCLDLPFPQAFFRFFAKRRPGLTYAVYAYFREAWPVNIVKRKNFFKIFKFS